MEKLFFLIYNVSMKKSLILFVLISAFSITSCYGKKAVETPNTAQETVYINPEYEKLSNVISRMSDKAKAEIHIDSVDQFLSDLHVVLATQIDDQFRLVDKKNYLPDGYVPKNLISLKSNEHYSVSRNDLSLIPYVETALCDMADEAQKEGIKLLVSSTYRSFEYQTKLFNRYVQQDGYDLAVRYSAPPGTSQHQMGVAIDFGSIDDSFADTKMGKWLNTNAWKYGWSLSFPQGYEDITGYMWECWHFRYLGKEACQFQKNYFNDIQQYMIEFIDLWEEKGVGRKE